MYTPTDDELDACPYDYPCHWIARDLDGRLSEVEPLSLDMATRTDADGRFDNVLTCAFGLSVLSYAKAVFNSGPGAGASVAPDEQHVTTLPTSGKGWDQRTFDQGPVVLALANGPFYAVAMVLRGDGLHLVSLGLDAASVRVV